MAVNKPMDKAMKDEDIGRKLQLYGIYCGFQNGKLPSVGRHRLLCLSVCRSLS